MPENNNLEYLKERLKNNFDINDKELLELLKDCSERYDRKVLEPVLNRIFFLITKGKLSHINMCYLIKCLESEFKRYKCSNDNIDNDIEHEEQNNEPLSSKTRLERILLKLNESKKKDSDISINNSKFIDTTSQKNINCLILSFNERYKSTEFLFSKLKYLCNIDANNSFVQHSIDFFVQRYSFKEIKDALIEVENEIKLDSHNQEKREFFHYENFHNLLRDKRLKNNKDMVLTMLNI